MQAKSRRTSRLLVARTYQPDEDAIRQAFQVLLRQAEERAGRRKAA